MFTKKQLQRNFLRTETFVFLSIVVLMFIIELRSGQFFSSNNIVDIARSLIVPAMFSIGAMVVLVSGGIDVSAPAIASLSMYLVSKWMIGYEGNVVVLFLMGAGIGLILGALNGYLAARFQFPTLIVTLGTASLFTGLLQGVFAAQEHPVPAAMNALGKAKLFSVENAVSGLRSNMPMTIFLLIALIILVWFILQKTMLGRGIYAVGGDVVSAQRAGFKVFRIYMFVYMFVGMLAGITGITRASMMMNCQPTNLNGMELTAIAACVLGGTNVNGGTGTITGVMLGVLLITIMSNSLILLGIPTFWQKIFTGLIILIGTGVSAFRMRHQVEKI